MKLRVWVLLSVLTISLGACTKYNTNYPVPDLTEGVGIFPKEIDGYLRQIYLLKTLDNRHLRGVKAVYGDNNEVTIVVINAYNPENGEQLPMPELKTLLLDYFNEVYRPKYSGLKRHKEKKKTKTWWIFEAQDDQRHVLVWQKSNWLYIIEANSVNFDSAVDQFKFVSRERSFLFWKK